MSRAVIVSYARTPIGKASRGAFNMTHGATMAGHVIQHAVQRAASTAAKSKTSSSAAASLSPPRAATLRAPAASAPACRCP